MRQSRTPGPQCGTTCHVHEIDHFKLKGNAITDHGISASAPGLQTERYCPERLAISHSEKLSLQSQALSLERKRILTHYVGTIVLSQEMR